MNNRKDMDFTTETYVKGIKTKTTSVYMVRTPRGYEIRYSTGKDQSEKTSENILRYETASMLYDIKYFEVFSS